MSDGPITSVPSTSAINDYSNPTPPSYGQHINLSPLNNPNNIYSTPVQYQPQPVGNVPNIRTTYNPQIQQISVYKGWSTINIILGFCCGIIPMILGIIACYCSMETDTYKLREDYPGALGASKYARLLNIIATVLIILIFLAGLLPVFIFFVVIGSI
jgi:hypothetical protein